MQIHTLRGHDMGVNCSSASASEIHHHVLLDSRILIKFGSPQCFLHSDLQNDRPLTSQFKEKLPWFLTALPSADCAKGGHGAYTDSVDLQG